MKYQKPYAVNLGDRLPNVMGACVSGINAYETGGGGAPAQCRPGYFANGNCSVGENAAGGRCGKGSLATTTCNNGSAPQGNCVAGTSVL